MEPKWRVENRSIYRYTLYRKGRGIAFETQSSDIVRLFSSAGENDMHGSSVSGIRAAVQQNNTSAHNVANVNTRGYGARSAVQAETAPSGTRVAAVRRRSNAGGRSNTDLAVEAGRQTNSRHAVSANAAVIRMKDQMLGSLLDLLG